MALRGWLEGRLGLGMADEPRRVAVESKRARVEREIRSTPGARVRIVRDLREGQGQRALLWCLRNGVPVELAEGEAGIFLDGRAVTGEELRRALTA